MPRISIEEFEKAYGQPVEPGDRIWVRFMASKFQATKILESLVRQGVSFTYDPYPGIEHEITVKPEFRQIVADAIEAAG